MSVTSEPEDDLEAFAEAEQDTDEESDDSRELDGEDDIVADDSESKMGLIVRAADSLKAEEITVLDLRGLTIIADFFVLCTGKSSIHIRSITDRIEERMRDQGFRKLRMEGYQEATWILLDYGDVVAHVMAAEQRAFYNLEAFWSQAPRIETDSLLHPSNQTQTRSAE